MGVTVIPDNYGGIAQSIGALAQETARAINPFHDLQIHMRNEIAQNPELAQHLADLESSSPGTLERMGLGNVGKSIAKIKPTTGQIIENYTKPKLEARLADEANGVQPNVPSTDLENRVTQLLSPTHLTAAEQATQQAGVKPAQVRSQAAGAFGNELDQNPDLAASAGASVVTGYRHGDFMSGYMGEQATKAAHNLVAQNPNYDLSVLAHKFAMRTIDPTDPEGQMSPDEQSLAQALSIDPGTSKYFNDAMTLAHQGIISDRMADRYSHMYERAGASQTAAMEREAMMAGVRTADGMHRYDLAPYFSRYYTDQKFQQHMGDVISGKVTAKDQEEGDFAMAIKSNGLLPSGPEASRLSNRRMKLIQDMTAIDSKTGKPKITDPDALQGMVDEYNQDSDIESEITHQPKITARVSTAPESAWNKLGFGKPGSNVVFERNNTPLDPGEAGMTAGGIGLQKQLPGLSSAGQRLLTQLKMNPKADVDGSIAEWAKALSPTDAAVIRSQLGYR